MIFPQYQGTPHWRSRAAPSTVGLFNWGTTWRMNRVSRANPETVWLTEGGRSDRHIRVLKPFWYRDWQGKQRDAPAGTIVDGATIPQALWTLVGSPYTGDYRRASIVHDVACVGATPQQRRAADKMFFQACRDSGCNVAQAIIVYTGVRIGAWASSGAAPMWKAPFFKMENSPKTGQG